MPSSIPIYGLFIVSLLLKANEFTRGYNREQEIPTFLIIVMATLYGEMSKGRRKPDYLFTGQGKLCR